MALSQYGVMDKQLSNSERWVCFFALFFTGFTSAYNLFKPSAMMLFIGADLGIADADLGLIMTYYSMMAMILAYPGMIIMQKFGVKFSVMLSAVLMLVGSVIGAIAQDSTLFLISRVIEGSAFGFICVLGPNIMPRLFPLGQQGRVMSIWSMWIPVGTIITFFIAPLIFDAAGWRATWYLSIAMEIIVVIWLFVSVKMPKVSENELVGGDTTKRKVHGKDFLMAASVIGIIFLIWAYIYATNINQLYPTFLQQVKGLSVFDSSMLPNWIAIGTLPLMFLYGILSDKYGLKKWTVAISYFILAVILFFCAFTAGDDMVGPWVFTIVMMVPAAIIPVGTRSIIPILAPSPKKTDLALAHMAFVTGVGMVLGVLASTLSFDFGWTQNAQFVLAPLAVISGIIIILFVKSDNSVLKTRTEEEDTLADAPESAKD